MQSGLLAFFLQCFQGLFSSLFLRVSMPAECVLFSCDTKRSILLIFQWMDDDSLLRWLILKKKNSIFFPVDPGPVSG